MPRQRMIKPEFFDSDSLAECSIPARLTFIGLWVMGDDYGNQKASIGKLKRNIYPCDDLTDMEFAEHLIELERVGCIKGYQVGDDVYINIPNFGVYQTIRKPSKARIPGPPERVSKLKKTTILEQYITSDTLSPHYDGTSGAPVAHQCGSDAPVTHYDVTSGAQKKEGSTTYFQKKGSGGTGAPVAAPPSPESEGTDAGASYDAFRESIEGANACLGFVRGES